MALAHAGCKITHAGFCTVHASAKAVKLPTVQTNGAPDSSIAAGVVVINDLYTCMMRYFRNTARKYRGIEVRTTSKKVGAFTGLHRAFTGLHRAFTGLNSAYWTA